MFNGVRKSWLILDKKLNFTLKLSSIALFFIFVEILNKDKNFTLIDAVNKKLNVIRDLSEKIGLEKN